MPTSVGRYFAAISNNTDPVLFDVLESDAGLCAIESVGNATVVDIQKYEYWSDNLELEFEEKPDTVGTNFEICVQRTQVQSKVFIVKANSRDDLNNKLQEIDFGNIDALFDEGEVESIDYEVLCINPTEQEPSSFDDEDLQDCLDNII